MASINIPKSLQDTSSEPLSDFNSRRINAGM